MEETIEEKEIREAAFNAGLDEALEVKFQPYMFPEYFCGFKVGFIEGVKWLKAELEKRQ